MTGPNLASTASAIAFHFVNARLMCSLSSAIEAAANSSPTWLAIGAYAAADSVVSNSSRAIATELTLVAADRVPAAWSQMRNPRFAAMVERGAHGAREARREARTGQMPVTLELVTPECNRHRGS